MLSKNNNRELQRKIDDRQDRFTLRKLSIGVASVLLGSFVMGTQLSQTAYASNDNSTSEEVPANSIGSSSTTPSLATTSGQLSQTNTASTNNNPSSTPVTAASGSSNSIQNSQAPNTQQASITDVPDYPNTNEIIPQNQYIFDQFHLTDNKYQPLNRLITLATDRNKPGENLYYYITDDQYTQQYSNGTIKDGENQTYEDSYGGPQEMQTYEDLYGGPKINIYNFGKDGISVNELTGNYGLALTFGYGKYQAMIKENPNPYAEDNVARAWGDTMPEKVTQTIKYVNGKTGENILQPYTQTGLTGQVYSAGKNAQIVVKGYYLVNSSRANGTISQFYNGGTYRNQWVDLSGQRIEEEWNQISPDGLMQCNIYINGQQQIDRNNPKGIVYPSSQSSFGPTSLSIQNGSYIFPNPYVESTKNIELKYLPLGKIIPVLPNGEVIPNVPQPQYQNDPNDPTGVESKEQVPDIPGYTPQEKTVTPKDPGEDTRVVYIKTDQKADLVVYDKTDNNKQLNSFNDKGKTGEGIAFSGAENYVNDLLAHGYKIDSFINDSNQTSNPSKYGEISYDNFDNIDADQHFKLYLVHGTANVTDKKDTTSTVHYVIKDGKATPPADHTETINWTRPGTKDLVTGKVTPTGSWTTPGHYTDVPTPDLKGYTPDKNNVPAPTPDPDKNPKTTVTYNPVTPEAPTYTATAETKSVVRTINYYDRVTGAKIPAELIHDNPTTQTVQLTRNHVVSSTGQDMGYGTVSADGKTFTKATNDDGWNTGKWDQVVSQDLTKAGYTAPDVSEAEEVNVNYKTTNTVVNVYYGHQTELVTPNTPHNPGDNINPNDPRQTPSTYPAGLAKTDLQQTVNRTIHYKGINENGQTVDVNGAPDGKNTYTQTVSFERHAVVDKVTGQVLGYDTDADTTTPKVTTIDANRAWLPATQNMTTVDSKQPSEVGYDNVDIKTVGGMTVYSGQQIADVTVTYTKNKTPQTQQSAHLVIIDRADANNPKTLANYDVSGLNGSQINFAGANAQLTTYLNQGYKFDGNEGAGMSGDAQQGFTYPEFDNDTETDQNFKIYLTHQTKDVNQTAKATAQVHYEMADGTKAPADSPTQTVTWTRTNTVDQVTGKPVQEGKWKADKDAFKDVNSPEVAGYTPSQANVQFDTPEQNVNQRVTVIYTKAAQAADLQIIDDNDPQNQRVLRFYSEGGKSGEQINFAGSNEALQDYLKQGYTFEKNDGQGMTGDATKGFTYPSFDTDSETNQSFKIYLKHGTDTKTTTDQTKAHVHYLMADGSTAPADSPTQTVTWTKTDTVDKVDGHTVKEGDWSQPQGSFKDVKSPQVAGYTPDTDNVSFQTPVRGQNQVVDVIYTKNPETPATQKAVVIYQDVNDPAHLVQLDKSNELTGNAGDAINYSTADTIANLEKEGYVLVSNGFDPAGNKPNFDNVNDNTQTFYVNLKHGIQPVNPTNPGTPDQPINPEDPRPNKDQPKYPAGTDKTSLTNDVTRTVTYEGAGSKTPRPVTDTLHFQGTGYLDKVTGKWTDANGQKLTDQTKGITWTIVDGTKDNGSFNLVPTKHIDGYTSQVVTAGADDGNGNVKGYQNINHSTADINVVVKYSPVVAEKGNLIVKFHDDADKKDLTGVGTDTGSQNVGTKITYSPNNDLTTLENEGYVYVSTDGNIPAEMVKGTTTVTIHVKHAMVPVDPENPGKPGQPLNPNDPRPKDDQPKYPDGTDVVTKTITRTIHYEGADQYTPDDVKQPVNFTAKGVLDNVTGGWVTPLEWSKDQTFDAKNTPKIPGYHVVSVDKDSHDNQNVDSATISHTGADYTVTVKYAKDQAPTPETTTGKVAYIDDTTHKTLKTDALNGNVNANIDYTTQDKINDYVNQGYKLVSNDFTDGKETFNADAAKNNFEVHLVHTYVPVTPTNPGTPDQPINPEDPRPNKDQPKYPAGTDKTSLTNDVTRTVTYEGAGSKTPRPVTDTLHFQGTGYLDKVTGKWTDANGQKLTDQTKGITWTIVDGTKDNGSFNLVPTKHIDGYTSQVVTAGADDGNGNVKGYQNINHSTADINVVVKYSPVVAEKGNLIVKFHDDADKKDLTGVGTDTGSQNVGTKITYSPNNDLTTLENEGYVYVSTDGNIPAEMVKGTTTVTIHVKHAMVPVDPENPGKPGQPLNPNDPRPKDDQPKYPDGTDVVTKTITRTIHYEGADQYTPDDVKQPVNFTAKGVLDNVTGGWVTPLEWSKDQTFDAKNTPKIPGYHVVSVDKDSHDNQNVDSATISHTGADYTVTVKYAKDQAPTPETTTGKVAYIDDTTHKTLKTDALNGNVNANIDYTTQDKINDYVNQGYKLVSNDFTDGKETFNADAAKNNFEVHLVHTYVPVTPTNPGTPDQPINPNDPNGPKWPDGTAKNDLEATGTQTIHYEGAGDKTPANNTQHFTFTKSATVDKVTGKIVSETGWNVAGHTFGNVDTPVVAGYHADKKVAGGATITPDDLNKTIVVTYAPNGHIIPVDPDGKPLPNVPQPQYQNNPNDPTEVTPNESVPEIPGYTPNVSTVTPKDPGKDTQVIYTQQGSVTVTVHDVTDNLDLPYGKTSGEENVGTTFTYDKNKVIQELENKGYKILNPDVVIPTTISKGAQNIVIKVKHELVPVTPGNQGQQWPDGIAKNDLEATGTQTIHYEGAGDKTPANNTQHFTFTKSATVDKVTGKIVSETGWNVAGHTFGNVDTPVVAGYHADKKVAGGATITPDDLNKTIVVTYAPNGHIIPVDPDGKPLPNVPQPQYQNNPNDPTEVTPNESVPEIPGYTPNVSTVTPENPGENTPVVYTPNKKTVGPTTPQPETPAKPMTPTTTPAGNGNIPANGQTTSPAGSSVTTSNVNKANATTPVAQKQAAQLPQTGNEQLKHERILGLLALGVAGLLVFGKMRRKE